MKVEQHSPARTRLSPSIATMIVMGLLATFSLAAAAAPPLKGCTYNLTGAPGAAAFVGVKAIGPGGNLSEPGLSARTYYCTVTRGAAVSARIWGTFSTDGAPYVIMALKFKGDFPRAYVSACYLGSDPDCHGMQQAPKNLVIPKITSSTPIPSGGISDNSTNGWRLLPQASSSAELPAYGVADCDGRVQVTLYAVEAQEQTDGSHPQHNISAMHSVRAPATIQIEEIENKQGRDCKVNR
ncbi:hypothetical protein SAMN05421819_1730 [Bryocella elongata]|uniref:Uncharacterized protein n=1 Tax=Bryocella elongata TaxID=863522 RepID=A0A1H5WUH4_9BACT|nr:hypothetical protein [Bryocella elongata]SEG02567.1 hypothetical protein SAMN05421819_1730 [Bryocella elongata]